MLKLVSAAAGVGLLAALLAPSPAAANGQPPAAKSYKKPLKKLGARHYRPRVRYRTIVRTVYVPVYRYRVRYVRPYWRYRYVRRYYVHRPYWRYRYVRYRPYWRYRYYHPYVAYRPYWRYRYYRPYFAHRPYWRYRHARPYAFGFYRPHRRFHGPRRYW